MSPFGFSSDDSDGDNPNNNSNNPNNPEDFNAMMRQMQEQIQEQLEKLGVNPAGFINPLPIKVLSLPSVVTIAMRELDWSLIYLFPLVSPIVFVGLHRFDSVASKPSALGVRQTFPLPTD